jgi:hypothetical protein
VSERERREREKRERESVFFVGVGVCGGLFFRLINRRMYSMHEGS